MHKLRPGDANIFLPASLSHWNAAKICVICSLNRLTAFRWVDESAILRVNTRRSCKENFCFRLATVIYRVHLVLLASSGQMLSSS